MTRISAEREPEETASTQDTPRGKVDNWLVEHEARNFDDQGILPHKTSLEMIRPALAEVDSDKDRVVSEIPASGSISKEAPPKTSETSLGHGVVSGLTAVGISEDGRPIYPHLGSLTQRRLEASGVLFAPPKGKSKKSSARRRTYER